MIDENMFYGLRFAILAGLLPVAAIGLFVLHFPVDSFGELIARDDYEGFVHIMMTMIQRRGIEFACSLPVDSGIFGTVSLVEASLRGGAERISHFLLGVQDEMFEEEEEIGEQLSANQVHPSSGKPSQMTELRWCMEGGLDASVADLAGQGRFRDPNARREMILTAVRTHCFWLVDGQSSAILKYYPLRLLAASLIACDFITVARLLPLLGRTGECEPLQDRLNVFAAASGLAPPPEAHLIEWLQEAVSTSYDVMDLMVLGFALVADAGKLKGMADFAKSRWPTQIFDGFKERPEVPDRVLKPEPKFSMMRG